MTRKMRFKPSLKQTVSEHEKAIRWMCQMGGKPIPPEFAEKPAAPAAPAAPSKPRKSVVKSDPNQLEASVMTDIADVYKTHPNILFAVRQNSGSAERNGVPVWFWKWMRRNGVEMTLTDTWGMLRDGRMFAIEAKERGWKGVGQGDSAKAVRERKQQAFIDVVKSSGGVGGFVTCAEDALALLS